MPPLLQTTLTLLISTPASARMALFPNGRAEKSSASSSSSSVGVLGDENKLGNSEGGTTNLVLLPRDLQQNNGDLSMQSPATFSMKMLKKTSKTSPKTSPKTKLIPFSSTSSRTPYPGAPMSMSPKRKQAVKQRPVHSPAYPGAPQRIQSLIPKTQDLETSGDKGNEQQQLRNLKFMFHRQEVGSSNFHHNATVGREAAAGNQTDGAGMWGDV